MHDQDGNVKEQEMVAMKRQQGWKGVRMKAQTVT